MMRRRHIVIAVYFLLAAGTAAPVAVRRVDAKQPDTTGSREAQQVCSGGTQASGALYEICRPYILPPWNGELVIYAHGYVPVTEPLAIPQEFSDFSLTANLLGYAVAASSYSVNGLAVLPALDDLLDLLAIFESEHGTPDVVYLVGPSQGGLIATLLAEQHPDKFDGAEALCAVNGDFQRQMKHIGDFRVVFDYFFPGLLPGSPDSVPQDLIDDWDNYYAANVEPVITDSANASKVDQVLAVTGAAYDPQNPATKEQTFYALLSFSVLTSNDAKDVLGGSPFDNTATVYSGSLDDAALNAGVARFAADQAALDELAAKYETNGQLSIPMINRHTTLDPIAPVWHLEQYAVKTAEAGQDYLHIQKITARYGHCAFNDTELINDLLELADLAADPPAPWAYRLWLPVAARE